MSCPEKRYFKGFHVFLFTMIFFTAQAKDAMWRPLTLLSFVSLIIHSGNQ
jgi:hypothetical protein